MADIENNFLVIQRQKYRDHCIGVAGNEQHLLMGVSLIDGSTFARTFPDFRSMENWLTTFEATQYSFA